MRYSAQINEISRRTKDYISFDYDNWQKWQSITPLHLKWVEDNFNKHFKDTESYTYLSPEPNGEIQVEWSNENNKILLIDPVKQIGTWTDNGENIFLKSEADWRELRSKI